MRPSSAASSLHLPVRGHQRLPDPAGRRCLRGLGQFVTERFVETIDSGGTVTTPSGSQSTESGSALVPLLVLEGGLAAGAGGLVLVGKRRRDKANAMSLAAVKSTVDEDITAFWGVAGLRGLPPRSTLGEPRGLDGCPRSVRQGETILGGDEDAGGGRHRHGGARRGPLVACVQARLSGEPVPDRRPPCFFDARHGRRQGRQYTPAGTAQPRDVPACAACSAVIEDGLDPTCAWWRQFGGRQPYWQAGRITSSYASGYYRGNGMDLFSTVLVGTMLGNMMMGRMYGGGWGGADGAWIRLRWGLRRRRLRWRIRRRRLRWRGDFGGW